MPKSKEPKILIGLGGIGGNIKHQLSKQQTKVINTPFFIDINTNDQSDSLDENAISNIMIGLGGLGGKIVYQLCEQLPKENTYPFYIDTDVSDLSIYPIEQRIHLADSSCLGSGQIRENGYHHFMKASQDHKFQSFYAQINHIICNTKNKVRIYIITSLVGGSGSGFFLSFAQELKNYLFKYTSLPCHLYGEFVLPTYFHKMISHSLNQRIRIEANAYASLKDMVDIEEIPFHQCDFYHKEDTVETISNQISKYIEYDILVPVDTQIISQYMETYQQAYEYHILHTKMK